MARSRKKITLPKSKPWLLLPGEDMSQWESFEHYLLMDPPRSIRRVADERQKSSAPTLYSWSRIYRWKERVRAYDLHMAQKEMDAVALDRLRVRRDQLRAAEKTRLLAERRINELRALSSLSKLAPRDALAMLEKAVQMERLILGESTERSEVATWDLSSLTDEQVDTLERLYRAAQGKG